MQLFIKSCIKYVNARPSVFKDFEDVEKLQDNSLRTCLENEPELFHIHHICYHSHIDVLIVACSSSLMFFLQLDVQRFKMKVQGISGW